MEIEIIYGDITNTGKDIIIQQVNCTGFMGAGLAKTIMQKYGNVRMEYINYQKDKKKETGRAKDLLGLVNYVTVNDRKVIANIFGQVGIRKGWGDKTVYTDTDALRLGLGNVRRKAVEEGLSIAIPTHIGCGLAGGNWDEIKEMIEEVFRHTGLVVVFYHYR